MVQEGRDIYADPCSMLRAGLCLFSTSGALKCRFTEKALDFCMYEKELTITGRYTGSLAKNT
jgi:isocitrate dehydrogenase (NAD+)